MLNLILTTDKLQILTSSTAKLDIQVSGTDMDNTTPSAQVFVPFKENSTVSASATTVDISAVPTSSHFKNIKFINIHNDDAAASNTVTVFFNANGTQYELVEAVLLFEETLVFSDGTWFHYDSLGGVYGPSLPVASDTVAGAIMVASRSDMQAASSTVLAATPGRVKDHPGVAKCTMFTTGTATPVAAADATYNCTLTDSGVGQLTVNVTSAFTSATAYCALVNVEIISTTLTAAANVMNGYMRFGGQSAAGTFQLNCCDRTATTNVIRDPISWHVAAFGKAA